MQYQPQKNYINMSEIRKEKWIPYLKATDKSTKFDWYTERELGALLMAAHHIWMSDTGSYNSIEQFIEMCKSEIEGE